MKEEQVKYRIKNKSDGTYYQYMTAIGPCFGGTANEAKIFDSTFDAALETKGRNWVYVLWEIEPIKNKKRGKSR